MSRSTLPWHLPLALLGATLLSGAALAQLSPGELSQAHAELEGLANCLKCHSPQRAVVPESCLTCHTALSARISAGKGTHVGPDFESCERCHIEHYGRDFELVYWGEEGQEHFEHQTTGWPLLGAHREVGCRECHRPERLEDPAELERGGANLHRTFLGLGTACIVCHDDPHRGQLGNDACLDCHTQQSWRPAPGFDHDRTLFPLLGAHRDLTCTACHDDGFGGDPLVFDTCAACHDDPHRGRLGNACATCHNPTGWLRIAPIDFDHDRTRFPLRGEHRSIACDACHTPNRAAGSGLAFASCADCHDDPHQGRLGATCATCHDPAGWLQVDRTGFDHDRTRFPLRGEHVVVTCDDCHTTGRAVARLAFETCAACHGDPHLGQLGDGNACASCHTTHGFQPSTFTVDDHQRSSFQLVASHLAVACIECHLPVAPEMLPVAARPSPARELPTTVLRFRFADTACAACHDDPHGGETAAVADVCESCHSFDSWSAITFDHHTATGFALDGGHARVACVACHPRAGSAGGRLRFHGTPELCAGCHRDPHFGTIPPLATQMATVDGTVDCADCHTVAAWSETAFDHLRDTGFALDGGHARLACADCHVAARRAEQPAERPAALPATCEGCHGSESLTERSSKEARRP